MNSSSTFSGWDTNIWNLGSGAPTLKQQDAIAYVKAGNISINGTTIELTAGTIDDAVAQINANSATTGVTASIENNKVVLTNTNGSSSKIALEEGTSDFFAVTGISTAQEDSTTPETPPVVPSSGDITIESDNGGNFDILTGLNGASILTGGVGGLKEDMVIAGQAGSYTIDQNGKNAFTLTIDAE